MGSRLGNRRGFTLLELLLALSIVAMLVTIAFGGLRVAVAAWSRGEDRAEVHQHARGLAVVLTRALGATYPYRASTGLAPDPVILFRGAADRVEFVTQAPPFPAAIPVAFTAAVIGVEEGDEAALVVQQRVLPNRDPFTQARTVLRDPGVRAAAFRYLDEDGEWRETWDAEQEQALPRAVQVTLSAQRGGRLEALPPVTVSLRVAVP